MRNRKKEILSSVFKRGLMYKTIQILVFSLFLLFFSAAAQTISGIVTDTNDASVENAEVNLFNQTKKISQTATDIEGKFSIDLNNSQNSLLLVKAAGFESFSKILPVNFNEQLKIILSPAIITENVTVSITRTETRLSETPSSVAVLNRKTLDATAAQTPDDWLRQIAGFNLFRRASSKTANPTAQGANLRGLAGSGASRAEVLLDGLSLNDRFDGWTYWSRAPPSVKSKFCAAARANFTALRLFAANFGNGACIKFNKTTNRLRED